MVFGATRFSVEERRVLKTGRKMRKWVAFVHESVGRGILMRQRMNGIFGGELVLKTSRLPVSRVRRGTGTRICENGEES